MMGCQTQLIVLCAFLLGLGRVSATWVSCSGQPWVRPQSRYATTTHIGRARSCQQRCAECENQSLSKAHHAHRPSTTSYRQLAAWSNGTILTLGARRPGLNSQSSSVGENHIDAECQDVLAFHTRDLNTARLMSTLPMCPSTSGKNHSPHKRACPSPTCESC